MASRHDEAVTMLAARVRGFYVRREQFRIYHGSTNSTRQLRFQRDKMVDTCRFTHILKIDTDKQTALVEPNVPMDKLVEETLKQGLLPPVVMEFPGITVGGGFAGTAGESSSFKHGFFDQTVRWIELVLANGSVITASSTENADLFHGAAGSFGTLGVTTLLEIQLMKAKPFVELTYHPVASVPEAIQKIEHFMKDPSLAYIDAILYAVNQGIIMTGCLVDKPRQGVRTQRFNGARDPWFYLHAKKALRNGATVVTEAIPIVDYLFRYDRGGFWVGAYAFKYFLTPFNRITRWLLDSYMRTRVMYHALHESGLAQQYIIQDLALPGSNAQEFIEYIDQAFGIYPLWLCPLSKNNKVTMYPRSSAAIGEGGVTKEILLNVGVWGPGPKAGDQFVDANLQLERKVRNLHGIKWLYAHVYYTEKEFWELYDRNWYDALRTKYDATSLPSIYDKVKVDLNSWKAPTSGIRGTWPFSVLWKIWPLRGLYGVWRATLGGDYLLDRKKSIPDEKKIQ